MNFSCPYCGGSRLEHLRNCPKVYSVINQKQFNKKAKKDYFGAAPNVFVGRYGYPKVNVGFLSNEIIPKEADNPKLWSEKNYKIPDIIELRSNLINSRFKAEIKSFDEKFLDLTQEVSLAKNPVDVEVHLNKKPQFKVRADSEIIPFGPSVKLEKAQITDNPKIPSKVDNIINDEIKAETAVDELYNKGYDEHYLTKIFSMANLGIDKKLVPTRWSITAVDDILGKKLLNKVRDFQNYDHVAHFGGYLGNYYLILFFPRKWSYELFETYTGEPDKSSTDFETYEGRKNYASNTVGGYYAARLGILEYLKNKKRQATVLALRFITDEYYMALGVWVVRQATRMALKSKPIRFSDSNLMLKYSKLLIEKKFGVKLDQITNKSVLLKQRTISDFTS